MTPRRSKFGLPDEFLTPGVGSNQSLQGKYNAGLFIMIKSYIKTTFILLTDVIDQRPGARFHVS